MTNTNKTSFLTNKQYNVAKDIVQLYIPGFIAFYTTIATVWNFAFTEQIVATLAALATLAGVVLKISSNRYQENGDGQLVVNYTDPEVDTFKLDIDAPIEELAKKGQIVLKVNDES